MCVRRAENHMIDTPFLLRFGNDFLRREDDQIHRDNRDRNLLILEHQHARNQSIAQRQALARRSTATPRPA